MARLNWIDTLFFGVRQLLANGVELPERPALNIIGATLTDNAAENRTDLTMPQLAGSSSATPGSLVQRDGQGGAAFAGLLTAGHVAADGLETKTFEVANATPAEVLFDGGFQSDGDILANTGVANASVGVPANGFLRWAASGLLGIWARRNDTNQARVLDFNPTTGEVTVGDDANATFATLRAGVAGEIRGYVAGNLKLQLTSTGVGFFGAAATRPQLNADCTGNQGAFAVGQALIALGLATAGPGWTLGVAPSGVARPGFIVQQDALDATTLYEKIAFGLGTIENVKLQRLEFYPLSNKTVDDVNWRTCRLEERNANGSVINANLQTFNLSATGTGNAVAESTWLLFSAAGVTIQAGHKIYAVWDVGAGTGATIPEGYWVATLA